MNSVIERKTSNTRRSKYYIETTHLKDLAKNNMTSIKPSSLDSGNEKLTTVGIGTIMYYFRRVYNNISRIHHGQQNSYDHLANMAQNILLTHPAFAIDR